MEKDDKTPSPSQAGREAKLAQALRANLRRRKQAARDIKPAKPDPEPST
jgi:hypothetical protein